MSKKAGQATNDGEGPSEKKKVEPKYNPSVLRECIQNNMDAISIMEKLGITHRQTLKHCVLKLMSDDKTYYEVKGLYLKNSSRPRDPARGVCAPHGRLPGFALSVQLHQ